MQGNLKVVMGELAERGLCEVDFQSFFDVKASLRCPDAAAKLR